MPDRPPDVQRLGPFAVPAPYLQQWKEKKDATEKAQKAQAEAARRTIYSCDLSKSAYDLNKEFGKAWDLDTLKSVANDESLPVERRAKAVEVMLMRIGEMSYHDAYLHEIFMANGMNAYEPHPIQFPDFQYQKALTQTVMAADPALFAQLSKSHDQLPSGRAPATEWMNMVLRDGGSLGSYESRQHVEGWMQTLDPETRGAALYHVADAAGTSDIGKHGRVTGFEVGVEPVSVGLQWEHAKDTHWQQAGRDVEMQLSADLKTHPEQQEAFNRGFNNASSGSHVEVTKDTFK